jgi:hypothetical protein
MSVGRCRPEVKDQRSKTTRLTQLEHQRRQPGQVGIRQPCPIAAMHVHESLQARSLPEGVSFGWLWRTVLHARSAEGDMTSKPGGDSFDPQDFLAKVGAGKRYRATKKIRSSSPKETPRIRHFIFKRVGSRSSSFRTRARKRSSGFWKRASSLGRDV